VQNQCNVPRRFDTFQEVRSWRGLRGVAALLMRFDDYYCARGFFRPDD